MFTPTKLIVNDNTNKARFYFNSYIFFTELDHKGIAQRVLATSGVWGEIKSVLKCLILNRLV